MIPEDLGQWQRESVKDSVAQPEELDINEIYQALYLHPVHGRVALTLEYTSDSRREFELHYPDVCHAIRGDEVVKYSPAHLGLSDGGQLSAAMMSWQQANNGFRAVTAYWYVTEDGVTTDSMKLKIKQALSGLFNRPEEAIMVRYDAFYQQELTPGERSDRLEAIQALNRSIETSINRQSNTLLYKHF